MRDIENFKEAVLREHPRLTEDSVFKFSCHKGVPCFNACCGDVNIFLTPYDVLRLRNNLHMTSGEFLGRHTISPFDENLKYPVVMLKMNDDNVRSCPFVANEGCSVYPDRPWACRMYPLGMASPKESSVELDEEFYFLLNEPICRGFECDRQWTIGQWLDDQGIAEYDAMGEYFKNLTLHKFFTEGGNLAPEKTEMFFVACYDLDRFREFLFDSSFFGRFEVEDALRERLRSDDVELLKFGYDWLRFALFGEKTMVIKAEVVEKQRKKLQDKK